MERLPGYDAWKLASPPDGIDWPDDEVREYRCVWCEESRAIVTTYIEDGDGYPRPVEDEHEVWTILPGGQCVCIYCAGVA